MHEQGLAIDFVRGRTIPGSTNLTPTGGSRPSASNYGLYNLPGEAWHWSVDGN